MMNNPMGPLGLSAGTGISAGQPNLGQQGAIRAAQNLAIQTAANNLSAQGAVLGSTIFDPYPSNHTAELTLRVYAALWVAPTDTGGVFAVGCAQRLFIGTPEHLASQLQALLASAGGNLATRAWDGPRDAVPVAMAKLGDQWLVRSRTGPGERDFVASSLLAVIEGAITEMGRRAMKGK